jgi:hypothetical protein
MVPKAYILSSIKNTIYDNDVFQEDSIELMQTNIEIAGKNVLVDLHIISTLELYEIEEKIDEITRDSNLERFISEWDDYSIDIIDNNNYRVTLEGLATIKPG